MTATAYAYVKCQAKGCKYSVSADDEPSEALAFVVHGFQKHLSDAHRIKGGRP